MLKFIHEIFLCFNNYAGNQRARLICISGIDGTGKTTQSNLILAHLRDKGIRCNYEWFRFHHLISLPLLAFCRIAGYTKTSTIGNKKCTYHEFHRSRIISKLYPWLLLIDTAFFATYKIYIPMIRCSNIICDRFVYDTLIDTSVAVGDHHIHKKRIGKLFLKLIPKNSKFIILCLNKDEILSRRPELVEDATFDERYKLYQLFINDFNLETISNNKSIGETNGYIMDILLGDKNDQR